MPPTRSVRIKGPALRDLRERRGLTVSQLAGKIARHPQSVRRLETGTGKQASKVFAWQLANALEADITDIADVSDIAVAEPAEDETSEEEIAA